MAEPQHIFTVFILVTLLTVLYVVMLMTWVNFPLNIQMNIKLCIDRPLFLVRTFAVHFKLLRAAPSANLTCLMWHLQIFS